MWPFNKKEKYTFEIDKDIYTEFCVATAQKNINDVIEDLMKDYIKTQKNNPQSKLRKRSDSPENINLFKDWLEKQKKSNGEPYSSGAISGYMTCVRKVCEQENITNFKDLSNNINKIIVLYDKGGSKEMPYEKGHGATIAALRLLQTYAQEK